MTSLLTLLNRFESAAGVYERSDDKADRDELHASRRAIMEAFDQAQKAIEALNICIEQDDKREAKLRAREAELVKALEPFADVCGELFNDRCAAEIPAWYYSKDGFDAPSPVTIGDFRRARAAIEPSLEQE